MTEKSEKAQNEFWSRAYDAAAHADQAEFECPRCGGQAWVMRPVPGGHIWAACRKCDAHMIE